jgi:hypothetical protein
MREEAIFHLAPMLGKWEAPSQGNEARHISPFLSHLPWFYSFAYGSVLL